MDFPAYNKGSNKPATDAFSHQLPQSAIPGVQNASRSSDNNNWILAALDHIFDDLIAFPGEDVLDSILAMHDPLLDSNNTVSSENTISQNFNRLLQTLSETKISSTSLVRPWDGCRRREPFCNKGTLDRHIKSLHLAPRSFKCPQLGCDWSFNRKDNLNQHRRFVHHHVIQKGSPLQS